MPNRYHTAFPSLKIKGAAMPKQKAGSTASMTEKPAFPSAKLPGKPSMAGWGRDTKKCKIYPKSDGI